MIVQIGIYKFGHLEIESFSIREGQKIIEIPRQGLKPLLQNDGAELWEANIGIRSTTKVVTDLEQKVIALLSLKREGKPVAFVQGENNWNMAMITDYSSTVEEMDTEGRPIVISASITLKEVVK